MAYTKEDLIDLYDGNLRWEKVKEIMSRPKDDDRFDKYVEILQERVPWPEQILLPVSEHLYVVQKDGERIVKCDCGYEFGDYRRNWKLSALIFARDSREKLEEIYPGASSLISCPISTPFIENGWADRLRTKRSLRTCPMRSPASGGGNNNNI